MKAEDRLLQRLRKLSEKPGHDCPVLADLRAIVYQYDHDKSIDKVEERRGSDAPDCHESGRVFPELVDPKERQ